jgi:uncharacterized protein involved in exopolysaccharide biosynthesis
MSEAVDESRLSLIALLNVVLRERWRILRTAVIALAIAAAVVLLLPRTWTSAGSFRPQQRQNAAAGLSGLAAQFGLSVPNLDNSQSPAFYADLLRSRTILGHVVDTQYTVRENGAERRASLMDLLEIDDQLAPGVRRQITIEKLGDLLRVEMAPRTGIVTFAVSTKRPELSEQIAQRMLAEVNRFNLESRQSQASAERRFTEGRLAAVRQELREAENRLEAFLRQNRQFRSSPDLTLQQERLRQDMSLHQDVYTTLAQAYEQAKIEEVRDTPVITVVEQPELAVRPDPRGLLKKGILAFLLGGALGVLFAFAREAMSRTSREAAHEVEQFRELRREALADLRFGRGRRKPA